MTDLPAPAGSPAGPPGSADPPPTGRPARADAPDRLPPGLRAAIEAATTARLFLPGGPSSYDTSSWLRLRADHAAARDAVHSALDPDGPALAGLVGRHHPLVLETAASGSGVYLTRPDLGRRLSLASGRALSERLAASPPGPVDVALVVGDGLSATAVATHAPALIDRLVDGAAARSWRVREPVLLVRHCRVGVLNDLGPRLDADVVVLLVGERPGLAAADSLSAYLAHRPGPGQSDADRNLISGIHDRGTPVAVAARRILDLVAALRLAGRGGVSIKEQLTPVGERVEAMDRTLGATSGSDGTRRQLD